MPFGDHTVVVWKLSFDEFGQYFNLTKLKQHLIAGERNLDRVRRVIEDLLEFGNDFPWDDDLNGSRLIDLYSLIRQPMTICCNRFQSVW